MTRFFHRMVATVALVPLLHYGCGRAPTAMDGNCDTPQDCQSNTQYVPGTTCSKGTCECADPTEHICCVRGEKSPGCFLQCLPCDACAIDTPGCPPPECVSDAGCPGAPDPRCGVGRCVDNRCTVEVNPGPIASQRHGDCARLECTQAGQVVTVPDQSDWYDDGNQCTADICDHQNPLNPELPPFACPVSRSGRCYNGACVDCVDDDVALNDCPGGLACDGVLCVPGHCINNVQERGLGETGLNCGGACRPCPVGSGCTSGADCFEGVCNAGVCKAAVCGDGVKNDSETGIDCGALSCPRCPPGQGCKTGGNCLSGVCWAGVCEEPSCLDGVQNGEERGVDCGGDCPPCP